MKKTSILILSSDEQKAIVESWPTVEKFLILLPKGCSNAEDKSSVLSTRMLATELVNTIKGLSSASATAAQKAKDDAQREKDFKAQEAEQRAQAIGRKDKVVNTEVAVAPPVPLDEELVGLAKDELSAENTSHLQKLYKSIGRLSPEYQEALKQVIADKKIDVSGEGK